jgi:hypothetical protein
MSNVTFPSGWYQDPTGQGNARYWNGTAWTESVDRGGVTVNVAIDSGQAQVPPQPGTQVSIPARSTGTQTVNVSSNNHSVMGIIFAIFFGLFLIVLVAAIVSENDSSNDGPPATDVAPVSAPPATDGG